MSKSNKLILGAFTFWPIVYMVIFFGFIFSQFLLVDVSTSSGEPPTAFFLIFILHFLTIILSIGLLIIYIRNVFSNNRIPQDKKALWAIVIFLGSFIAMPIYWYLYIWSEHK